MATGDDAVAAGFALVAATDDIKMGYNEINKTRDYIAQTETELNTSLAGKAATSHTHAASAVTSGTFSTSRIPDLSASKITSGTIDSDRLPSTLMANGPTDSAYARNATGSSWYAVWMNSSNQFMRNTSSCRYKENIETITGETSLDLVENLRPVFYTSIENPEAGRHVGLIAEEVYEILPEVVPLMDGQPEAVNYEFLVAPLIGAVQELSARVAALEGRHCHCE